MVAAIFGAAAPSFASPTHNHVVVVILENHGYSEVIGNPNMPYFNSLAAGGLLLTDSHGVEHPSQPNYLDLFSGSNQGVTNDDPVPGSSSNQAVQRPLTTPNLAEQLIHAGLGFKAYSEDLPAPGSLTYYSDGTNSYHSLKAAPPNANLYVRKHNPWTNWQAASGYAEPGNSRNTLPASVNQPLSAFPRDFSQLPTVSFVIPNQCNNQHGSISKLCSNSSTVGDDEDVTLARNADNFLKKQLGAFAGWAKANNSLLIVTFDEDDFTRANHIATIFYGAGVPAGTTYGGKVNHFDLLRTIESFYGLPGLGNAAKAKEIPLNDHQ
jgi:hypothetical protein